MDQCEDEAVNSERSNEDFDQFVAEILMIASIAWNIPYDILVGTPVIDLSCVDEK